MVIARLLPSCPCSFADRPRFDGAAPVFGANHPFDPSTLAPREAAHEGGGHMHEDVHMRSGSPFADIQIRDLPSLFSNPITGEGEKPRGGVRGLRIVQSSPRPVDSQVPVERKADACCGSRGAYHAQCLLKPYVLAAAASAVALAAPIRGQRRWRGPITGLPITHKCRNRAGTGIPRFSRILRHGDGGKDKTVSHVSIAPRTGSTGGV